MTVDQTKFLLDNFLCTFVVEDNFIHLECVEGPPSNFLPLSSFDKFIELDKVISSAYGKGEWRVDKNGNPVLENTSSTFFSFQQPKLSSCFAFSIHHWVKSPDHCRKLETVKLLTYEKNSCMHFHELIKQELFAHLKQHDVVRPQNLLIFINPYSGRKEAKSIYDQIVSPLFEKANIKRTVITTTYQGHAKEYVESNDISWYDGIVAISGDGTMSEIINGVLVKEQKKQGILLDGEDYAFNKPRKPIYAKSYIKFGIIPGGSTNSLNLSSQGTRDPETATLQIICGESHPLDIPSIHDEQGDFLTFFLLTSVFGHPSEFHKLQAKLRNLGPVKAVVAGLLSFLNLKSYAYEVHYLPNCCGSPADLCTDTSKCMYPCKVCCGDIENSKVQCKNQLPEDKQTNTPTSQSDGPEDLSWKVLHGNLITTTLMNTPCKFPRCPNGPSPSAHLSDGCIDFVLVENVPILQYLSYLRAVPRSDQNHFAFPFIKCHRLKAIQFRILASDELTGRGHEDSSFGSDISDQTSPQIFPALRAEKKDLSSAVCKKGNWSIDGDKKFDNHNFTLWVHRGLINIFSRGLEEVVTETPV